MASSSRPLSLSPDSTIDQRTQRVGRILRVAGLQAGGLLRQPVDEVIGDRRIDHQPFGGHADLALVEERTEGGGLHRGIEIGIVEHHERRLAAELEQRRLQLAGRLFGDDPTDAGRAGEVDATHRGVLDQRRDHLGGLLGGVADHVDHTLAEPRLDQHFADQLMSRRALLRSLENHRVAAGQRGSHGPRTEDDRRVPRRNAQHRAARHAHAHRQAAGHVGRNHLATHLGGQARRLAQHAGGDHHVEAGPARRGAGLGDHPFDERVLARLHQLGGLEQLGTPLAGAALRPGLEGLAGGTRRGLGILDRGRGGASDGLAAQRIGAFESGPATGIACSAAQQ